MSLYALKPRFQALLRPLVRRLFALGVTANQVTLATCAISVALGVGLYLQFAARPPVEGDPRLGLFLCLPLWWFLRMALNAVDGMLAREFGQQSRLGAYLNELTDVIADAALVAPFALVTPFAPVWVATFAVLAGLSEFAGALGVGIGGERRYDGPMGKSDRALVLGALALWLGIVGTLPAWMSSLFPALCALIAWTVVRRVRNGLRPAG